MKFGRKRAKHVTITTLADLEPMLAEEKPVLIDFFQIGCGPCRVMDGIVNELAEEFGDGAHIVKVNVTRVPGAVQAFKIRSTPTFVLLGKPKPPSKKKAKRSPTPVRNTAQQFTPRWRASGLVRKDQLVRVLESNGAVRPVS